MFSMQLIVRFWFVDSCSVRPPESGRGCADDAYLTIAEQLHKVVDRSVVQ